MAGENNGQGEVTIEQLQAQIEELKQSTSQLKTKNSEYERLLLDPTYLEYIEGGRRREEPVAKKEPEKEIDFESMSKGELVEYMINTFRGELRQVTAPLKQDAEVQKAAGELKEMLNDPKTADVLDYKDEMVKIARKHPTITPREAYQLAKSQATKKPAKETKGSEPPTGGGSVKRKAPEGFEAKFMEAWTASGLGNSGG